MSTNKSSKFEATDQQVAAWAKALAHPARVAILRVLAERGTCVCGEVVEILPLAQSTISQHLKELKEAGLVSGEVDGPRMCYCINVETIATAQAHLAHFFSSIQKPLDACC